MRIVAHVSDLHFGTEVAEVAEALLRDLDGSTAPLPALVAISGDLTQRAKKGEFKACRAFLDRLPGPFLAVPGNHDLPLYNVVARFGDPLERYRRWIDDSEMPTFADGEIAVAGLVTPRSFKAKGGRITRSQAEHSCAYFSSRSERWKLIVAHHPLVLPEDAPDEDRVDGAETALRSFERCEVDLILTGHLHIASANVSAFRNDRHTIVSLHSGTSISDRLRGEANGYNRIVLDGEEMTITHRVFDGVRFVDGGTKCYRQRQHPHVIDKVAEAPTAAGALAE